MFRLCYLLIILASECIYIVPINKIHICYLNVEVMQPSFMSRHRECSTPGAVVLKRLVPCDRSYTCGSYSVTSCHEMCRTYLIGHGLQEAHPVAEALRRETHPLPTRTGHTVMWRGRGTTQTYHVILKQRKSQFATPASSITSRYHVVIQCLLNVLKALTWITLKVERCGLSKTVLGHGQVVYLQQHLNIVSITTAVIR